MSRKSQTFDHVAGNIVDQEAGRVIVPKSAG